MPFSSENGKATIKWLMARLPKKDRMLDIGVGCGTYRKLFPDGHWTGVEIWEEYVSRYHLKTLYNELIIADAAVAPFDVDMTHYDVAFAGDVLEHMTVEEAQALVRRLRDCADTVIISIPIGHYPQDIFEGNPYEIHITDNWSRESFIEAFGKPTFSAIDGEIGVFVYSSLEEYNGK